MPRSWQPASALAATARGIAHLDIKPERCFLAGTEHLMTPTRRLTS